jgi:hypothetical protein
LTLFQAGGQVTRDMPKSCLRLRNLFHRKTNSGLKPRPSGRCEGRNVEGDANPFHVCFERLRMNACRDFLLSGKRRIKDTWGLTLKWIIHGRGKTSTAHGRHGVQLEMEGNPARSGGGSAPRNAGAAWIATGLSPLAMTKMDEFPQHFSLPPSASAAFR